MTLTDEQRKLLSLHGFVVDRLDPLNISLIRGVGHATDEAAETLLLLLENEHRRDVETDKVITERFERQIKACMEGIRGVDNHKLLVAGFSDAVRKENLTLIQAIITDHFKP